MVCQFELCCGGGGGFYVTHAAIAQLKSIPVKDPMEWVEFRKVVNASFHSLITTLNLAAEL